MKAHNSKNKNKNNKNKIIKEEEEEEEKHQGFCSNWNIGDPGAAAIHMHHVIFHSTTKN